MAINGSTTYPPALILAAGRGNRLLPLTKDRPKCLLEVGGEPVLIHQLRALRLAGVRRFEIVTGHGEAIVRSLCETLAGDGLTFSHNAHYATTSSLFSLGCARTEPGPEGVLILNSDVLFHPALARRLLEDRRPQVLLADTASHLGEEEMKIQMDADCLITAISKSIDPTTAQAENLGVLKVGPEAARAMLALARDPEASADMAWVPDCIHALRHDFQWHALPTAGLPWIEIDYQHDLRRARAEVWPKIATAFVP